MCAAVTLVSMSSFSYAHETSTTHSIAKIKFTGDTEYSGFCKAIVENDVDTLLSQAARIVGKVAPSRRGVMRVVTSEAGVTCKGKSLLEFSEEKQANDVYAYLVAQR